VIGRGSFGETRAAVAGLVAVTLLLFAANLGGARALTYHEALVAASAQRMLDSGDWLVPHIGDLPWLEKPPLLQWIIAALMSVFGRHREWVARAPSVAAGLGVVLLVGHLVARRYGRRAGLLAGLVQATTVYTLTYARLGEQDMLLALLVVATLCTFADLQGIGVATTPARPRLLAVWFFMLLGVMNLLKGLAFGAVLTALPCIAWLAAVSDRAAWRRMVSPLGMFLGLAVAVAWPLAVSLREADAWRIWLAHSLGRVQGEIGFAQGWWYYLTTPWWQLLPWTVFVVAGAAASFPRAWRVAASFERFVWLWAILPIAALSLSAGKHHHYLLPCLPAFTVMAVWGADAMGAHLTRRPALRCALVGLTVAAVLAATAVAVSVGQRLPGGVSSAWGCATIVALGTAAAAPLVLGDRQAPALAVFVATVVATVVFVHFTVLPARDPSRFDRAFLNDVATLVPEGSPLIGTGGLAVARLCFYVRRPITCVVEPGNVARHVPAATTAYVLARGDDAEELAKLGTVSAIARSPSSRGQRSPTDPWTLFRLARGPSGPG